MAFMVPVSPLQPWAFFALSLVFFLFLFRAFSRRRRETGAKRDRRSRLGILLQSIGIGVAGFGPSKITLLPLGLPGLAGTAAVVLSMTGAIMLFAASSSALGRNWSIVARTRSDHQLIRSGPYARVRHPIYLGLLLFLFGLALALGHWLQLALAVPLYLAGTQIRTRIEDRLLEQTFGDAFLDYRNSTPALLPRLF
jgi:protein-S-isoprenylcysteine O-methyltransferase Ste14